MAKHLTASAILTDPDVHAGADSVITLLRELQTICNSTVSRFGDEHDGRDYAQAAEAIDAWLRQHCSHPKAGHRQGVLLALADMLMLWGEGATVPLVEWDPLRTVHAAMRLEAAAAGGGAS